MEGKGGRDHSLGGFTVWLAGGGIKGGQVIGDTDEVGYTAVENVVRPCDLHATMLHALEIATVAVGQFPVRKARDGRLC